MQPVCLMTAAAAAGQISASISSHVNSFATDALSLSIAVPQVYEPQHAQLELGSKMLGVWVKYTVQYATSTYVLIPACIKHGRQA